MTQDTRPTGNKIYRLLRCELWGARREVRGETIVPQTAYRKPNTVISHLDTHQGNYILRLACHS